MAADSREPDTPTEGSSLKTEPPSSERKPKYEHPKSQTGKLWQELGNPEQPVNLMPGGTYNSPGGKPQEVTLGNTIKSLSLSDLTSFYKTPCARDSLLIGIGTGFGVGGIRAVLGGLRSLWTASNWAVGSFAIASFTAHELCQRHYAREREGMKEAVDLMMELKVKKQKEQEQALKERKARQAEEEKRRKSWTNLSNYKFW